MKTVIAYGKNRFIVQEMTDSQKKRLKADKPELYERYFKKNGLKTNKKL
jgi:hypothetical protein